MEPTHPLPPRSIRRTSLASVAAASAAIAFTHFTLAHTSVLALALPCALLVAAAALVWRRDLPSHVLARAVCWSNLLLGALLAISGGSNERGFGALLAAATGVALLAMGRAGLEHTSRTFSPAAFRGSLVVALVMALADTQSLALFGGAHLEHAYSAHHAWPLLAGAAVMGIAIVGLYRLRVWGLVLNLVANLVIAGAALAGAFEIPHALAWALASTALVQLALPLPMIAAMIRGRAPASSRDRVGARLIPAVIVGLIALACVSAASGHRLVG
ncbi:MAG: hypothetical protein R3B09_33855 [Nannocystaceae bacterium]